MSLALKRKLPKIYNILKKFEKYFPTFINLWDGKKYLVNLKVSSMLSDWKNYPRLNAESKAVFEIYNGGDFIDIGAYHGAYSFILAPKAKEGDVFISCEPDLDQVKDLLENINVLKKLFKSLNFLTHYEPISNSNKVMKLQTNYGHPMFFNNLNFNNLKNHEIFVKSIFLDELVKEYKLKPTFIKIDVEGAEKQVIQSMKHTLKKYKPLIMIEKHPTLLPKGINIEHIDDELLEENYKLEMEIYKDDIAITEIWRSNY